MTAEELTSLESRRRLADIAERTRPLTTEEISRLFLNQQINTLTVDDSTALRMKDYYPEWNTGVSYSVSFKVLYENRLWRAIQAHTSQVGWEPDKVASLWEHINETHDGTIDDPIPYDCNMTLSAGKYYYQDGAIYLCNRDSDHPVYHSLVELVGLYVEQV